MISTAITEITVRMFGADHRDVRQLRERGDDRRAARRDLHRDRHRVVDEQRDRRDLRHPRPEVLPRHHVGAARPGVDGDDLAVGEHDERDAGQDDQRHRQDQRERREADDLDHLDQHFLGAVRGRGDAVAGQHAERERPGQPLLAHLLVDERRAEQLPLELVAERLGQLAVCGRASPASSSGQLINHRGLNARSARSPMAASAALSLLSWALRNRQDRPHWRGQGLKWLSG